MPILKTTTTNAGAAVGYHRLRNFKFDHNANLALAHFEGWVDEAAYIAGKPIMWNTEVAVALSSLSGGNFVASLEAACVTNGELSGGTVVADNGDTVDGLKVRKLAELSDKCREQIVAGFPSSALGAVYTYPAKPLDQENLSGSVLASILPGTPGNWTTPFWCADNGKVWDFRMHTAAQIQQVGVDAKNSLLAALGKNQQLGTQVAAATTIAQVNAIIW